MLFIALSYRRHYLEERDCIFVLQSELPLLAAIVY